MKRWLTFIFLLLAASALAHAPAPSVSGLDLSGGLAGAGGIGGLLARTDAEGSTFYHHDGAGNVTGLMDAQGNMAARYLYGPFGKVLGQWGPMAEANRYQFSSKETEALSGLSYYGYRFYDPGLQRWLNPDPLGEAGGLNLYGFVGNSPLSQVDPDGLLFRELFEQMGSGLVNLMMGPEPGRYNQMTQGAMIANELGGIDRNDNPLSGSIQEAVALLGDAATDQAAGYAGGKLLGAGLGAVCKKLPKFPWQKVGPAAGKEAGALTYNELRQAGVNLTDKMTGNQFRKLVENIKQYGLQDKVLNFVKIGDENYVVLGNNRLQAARQLGITDQLIFKEVQLPFRGFKTENDVINAAAEVMGGH